MESRAEQLYVQKDYIAAKNMYLEAQQAYIALGNQQKADEIKALLDQVDADAAIMATLPQ